MNRRSLSLALFLLVVVPGEGRSQYGPVSVGVLAGANVADQAGADVFTPHDVFGFIGGAFLRVDLSSRVAIQIEALYAPKGGKENTDKNPEDDPDRLKIEYLEIPLLLRFSLSSGGVRPSVFAGPSVGIELSCEYDAYPGGASGSVPCLDAGILTRPADVGVAFGADLDIPLGAGSLVIDGRGIVGLGTIDDSPDDLDYRNRLLSLTVGYRFHL